MRYNNEGVLTTARPINFKLPPLPKWFSWRIAAIAIFSIILAFFMAMQKVQAEECTLEKTSLPEDALEISIHAGPKFFLMDKPGDLSLSFIEYDFAKIEPCVAQLFQNYEADVKIISHQFALDGNDLYVSNDTTITGVASHFYKIKPKFYPDLIVFRDDFNANGFWNSTIDLRYFQQAAQFPVALKKNTAEVASFSENSYDVMTTFIWLEVMGLSETTSFNDGYSTFARPSTQIQDASNIINTNLSDKIRYETKILPNGFYMTYPNNGLYHLNDYKDDSGTSKPIMVPEQQDGMIWYCNENSKPSSNISVLVNYLGNTEQYFPQIRLSSSQRECYQLLLLPPQPAFAPFDVQLELLSGVDIAPDNDDDTSDVANPNSGVFLFGVEKKL